MKVTLRDYKLQTDKSDKLLEIDAILISSENAVLDHLRTTLRAASAVWPGLENYTIILKSELKRKRK